MNRDELLAAALEALRHYRTRAHRPVPDTDDWLTLANSMVHVDAVQLADTVLAHAKADRLLPEVPRW